jgi:1,2-diacylglycerol 3-alpha-glucosyltransferase
MNILVVNPILFTSENYVIPEIRTIKETMIYAMCMGFVANGHRVTLAAAADYKPIPEETGYEFDVLFFKSVFTKPFLPAVLPLSFDFYKYLKVNYKQYDLVVCSEIFSFYSLFASIVCSSKTAIWQEMMLFQRMFRKIPAKFWYWVIAPLFMRRVKCVIPRSEKACVFISKFMKNVSSEYVDHGINLSLFDFSKEKKRQLIISSQLIYRKNIESILEIYSRLIKIEGYGDIKLVIAGRGEYRAFLEERIVQLQLQEQVAFLGFLSQKVLNNRIKESLAFLINTRQDNNMLSIPESIVSGTPVITNLVPNMAEHTAKEKLGIAKDSWNEYDIIELIDNNAFFVDNCINYRDKLTNHYCAKKIVDIYFS